MLQLRCHTLPFLIHRNSTISPEGKAYKGAAKRKVAPVEPLQLFSPIFYTRKHSSLCLHYLFFQFPWLFYCQAFWYFYINVFFYSLHYHPSEFFFGYGFFYGKAIFYISKSRQNKRGPASPSKTRTPQEYPWLLQRQVPAKPLSKACLWLLFSTAPISV